MYWYPLVLSAVPCQARDRQKRLKGGIGSETSSTNLWERRAFRTYRVMLAGCVFDGPALPLSVASIALVDPISLVFCRWSQGLSVSFDLIYSCSRQFSLEVRE